MIRITAALLSVVTWSLVCSDELDGQYGKVVGITLLHRHGARTIDKYMKSDPYALDEHWREGIGELTKVGILQHYAQGQWIAKQYKHLLPSHWTGIKSGIKVYSTDWNRTIMSAQAELAGMFRIKEEMPSWGGLTSYLVPIHTIPESQDALLEVTKPCPQLKSLLEKNIKSSRYQQWMMMYPHVKPKIESVLGEEIKDLDNFQQVHSILSIEVERGHKLSESLADVYPNPLGHLAQISFAAPTSTDELRRLRGGPMINEFIKNIQDKIDNPNFRGVTIYSAHDTTISAFLNSLNELFTKEKLGPPPFAALVIIEHRQKDQNNFLRILYRCPYSKDESPECNTTPRVLTVPGCSAVCPFDKFKSIVDGVRPADWELECRLEAGRKLMSKQYNIPDTYPIPQMRPPTHGWHQTHDPAPFYQRRNRTRGRRRPRRHKKRKKAKRPKSQYDPAVLYQKYNPKYNPFFNQ